MRKTRTLRKRRIGKTQSVRKPRTAQALRKYVTEILAEHGITAPPIPVIDLAEKLGARVRLLPFEGELAGILVRRDDEKIIGVNSLHHPNRQRFTIAHEIGHLLLHKADVHLDKTFVHRRDETSSRAVDPDEIEANRFAAELLMPYEMIMEDLLVQDIDVENENELKELARRYQASVQSLTIRVTNLLGV